MTALTASCPTAEPTPRAIPVATIPPMPDIIPGYPGYACQATGGLCCGGLGAATGGLYGDLLKKPLLGYAGLLKNPPLLYDDPPLGDDDPLDEPPLGILLF